MPRAKSVGTSPTGASGGARPQVGAFRHRHEATAWTPAPPRAVFDRLDDQTRLAEHMGRPSVMMGGGRMTYEFDAGRGQAVGSHIRMGGAAFGLSLFVDEVVTVRDPPHRKVWRTTGEPRLLVVGGYEMGFAITQEGPVRACRCGSTTPCRAGAGRGGFQPFRGFTRAGACVGW